LVPVAHGGVGSDLVDRIVEVRGDRGPGRSPRYRYGSGFVVGGRTVLTAAHVLVDALEVELRGSDKRTHPVLFARGWIADPERCDLALLELSEAQAEFSWVGLAVIDPKACWGALVESCWSVGFPRFAEVTSKGWSVRKSAHVAGTIAPLSNLDDGLLSLQVRATPEDLPGDGPLAESAWSGMSGAPVFAGKLLVGVVAEHARRRGRSNITATPLAYLCDPGRAPSPVTGWWARLGIRDPAAELVTLPLPGTTQSTLAAHAARVFLDIPPRMQKIAYDLELESWVKGRDLGPLRMYYEDIEYARGRVARVKGDPSKVPTHAQLVPYIADLLYLEEVLIRYVLQRGYDFGSDDDFEDRVCRAAAWQVLRTYEEAVASGTWTGL
jgi:hypothetical protein